MKSFGNIRVYLAVAASALVASSNVMSQESVRPTTPVHAMPAKGMDSPITPLINTGHGITYHGGPIMPFANVYLIWYGSWAGDTSTTIIPDFVSNIGGSAYFSINTTYDESDGAKVLNFVSLQRSITDNYSRGTQLSDADVRSIVTSAAGTKLILDGSGIYVVLTSPDVKETGTGFPTFCGWHSSQVGADQVDLKVVWIGNPTQQAPGCMPQNASSPNGNVAADAMVSTLAHELDETVSDPDLNAWNNGIAGENADLCLGTFGTTFTVPNGSLANVTLGSRNYLIQQAWVNSGGGHCDKLLASGAVPAAPTGILAHTNPQVPTAVFTITWDASPGATWYNLCNGTQDNLSTPDCQGPTGTSATERLGSGTSARYRVQGCNAAGCGPWSPFTKVVNNCHGDC